MIQRKLRSEERKRDGGSSGGAGWAKGKLIGYHGILVVTQSGINEFSDTELFKKAIDNGSD